MKVNEQSPRTGSHLAATIIKAPTVRRISAMVLHDLINASFDLNQARKTGQPTYIPGTIPAGIPTSTKAVRYVIELSVCILAGVESWAHVGGRAATHCD